MPWLELLKKIAPFLLKLLSLISVGAASSAGTQIASNPAWTGSDMMFGVGLYGVTSAASYAVAHLIPSPNLNATLNWVAEEVKRGGQLDTESVSRLLNATMKK